MEIRAFDLVLFCDFEVFYVELLTNILFSTRLLLSKVMLEVGMQFQFKILKFSDRNLRKNNNKMNRDLHEPWRSQTLSRNCLGTFVPPTFCTTLSVQSSPLLLATCGKLTVNFASISIVDLNIIPRHLLLNFPYQIAFLVILIIH